MNRPLILTVVAFAVTEVCSGARCTTILDPRMLQEYDHYVSAAEQVMTARFEAGELAWAPPSISRETAAKLAAGKAVRFNASDASLNERIAVQNATIIHWIGAIRIPGVTLAEVDAVLQDYDRYRRIYRPLIFESRADRSEQAVAFDAVLGLQSTFRFVSLFPQHYAFTAKVRVDHSGSNTGDSPALRVHMRASEIRESDSGAPGRDDLLEPYRDHGIMWGLNTYWRARPHGRDIYLEFETITLARSVYSFICRLGVVPVPRSAVAAAMESLPAESVAVILEGTKAECARRAVRPSAQTSRQ